MPTPQPLILNENRELKLNWNPFQQKGWDVLFDENGDLRPDCPTELALFGGYGNGKSAFCLVVTWIFCITYPGLRWIFCREYGTELLDSVIPQFLEMFPPHLGENHYRYFKQPKEARFSNGSTIFFRAFDSVGVRKILSSSYDGGCICQAEQTSKSLVLELIGRFRSMALPRKILLVEGNPDPACWPKKRYISGSLPKGCVYFEAPTQVNEENLIDNYVDRMKENYPKEWIDRKIYGKWDSKSGVIYSEFDLDFHVINRFEIKDWWFKAVGVDHG